MNKKRVLKAYLKKAKVSNGWLQYILIIKQLPLKSILVLEDYEGRCYVLKINFFRRNSTYMHVDVYATNTIASITPPPKNRYVFQIDIRLSDIKSWKHWTPKFAPLTVNWGMSDWYKTMAFGSK